MSEEERIFHKLFYKQGGLFDPDEFGLDDASKKTLDYLKGVFKMNYDHLKHIYSDLPPIYFDFINNFNPNGAARNYNGEYFIGQTIGVYGIFAELFNKSLASGELLKDIGNADLESKTKTDLNFIVDEKGHLKTDLTQEQLIPIFPIDPVRRAYADLYTQMAMEFLMFHELGHVIHGHCAYLENKLNLSWNEFQMIDTDGIPEDSLNRQTMEMDADRFAIGIVINRFKEYLINPRMISVNPLLTDAFKNSETFFLHWTFAIYTFFRLTGFEDFDSNKMNKATHPPPSVRVLIMMTILATMFRDENLSNKNLSNIELEKITKKLVEMLNTAEETYSFMAHEENQGKTFAIAIYKAQEYPRKLCKNWNVVRELLLPFAINPELLPAPFTD